MDTGDILRDAASIWQFLKRSAGMDSIFYDREILDGNESVKGLYEILGMQKNNPLDFGKDLQEQRIGSEEFLSAFFECLQPYSRMMEDICLFFERHGVRHGDKAMRIDFDFDGTDENAFSFDLDNFRETITNYRHVKPLTGAYAVGQKDLWDLRRIFCEYLPQKISNTAISLYRQDYQQGIMRPNIAILPPDDVDPLLGIQLQRVWSIWESFISTAEIKNINRTTFMHFLQGGKNENLGETTGWKSSEIAIVVSDYWPVALLESIFYRIDMLASLDSEQKQQESVALAQEIKFFLDERTLPGDEMQLLEKLEDLLNLPIWQRRHELYAAWILSEIDSVFHEYPNYRLHHQNGVLTLPFKATHLASFQCDKGDIELWSEAKTEISNPEGKGRKANIQPDYTFFSGEGRKAEDGCAVVEVKQYRKPNNRNFRSAMNDYGTGLPNAYIFLVNYMAVPSRMDLKYPERSCALGHIAPGQSETNDFTSGIKGQLPVTITKELQGISSILKHAQKWPLETVYVDISASLNTDAYRSFLKEFITSLISSSKDANLVAVDKAVQGKWSMADSQGLISLLGLPFENSTNFADLLDVKQEILVITDPEGLQDIKGLLAYMPKWHILLYQEGQPSKLVANSP